jgi:hypothetical protein
VRVAGFAGDELRDAVAVEVGERGRVHLRDRFVDHALGERAVALLLPPVYAVVVRVRADDVSEAVAVEIAREHAAALERPEREGMEDPRRGVGGLHEPAGAGENVESAVTVDVSDAEPVGEVPGAREPGRADRVHDPWRRGVGVWREPSEHELRLYPGEQHAPAAGE